MEVLQILMLNIEHLKKLKAVVRMGRGIQNSHQIRQDT